MWWSSYGHKVAATTPDGKCVPGGKEEELDAASYFLPSTIENTAFHWPKLNHVTILVARDAGGKSNSLLAYSERWQGKMRFAMADG